jgi:RHS repeat-associated protein
MKTTAGSVTDYCGNFIYADNQLITIFAGDVRVAPVNVGNSIYWKYEYSMKDHTSAHFGLLRLSSVQAAQCQSLSTGLGNIRVVFAAHSHGQPELLQQTSYYPFGMTMQQQNFSTQKETENKYLYNSKLERSGNPDPSGELQDDQLAGNELDWYDYGARFYDATLGRWHVVDPLGEKYYSISTYAYVANNPMIFIDPDGRKIVYGQNVSEDFKKAFAQSVQHLNKHGASGMMAKLHASETVYNITETTGGGFYDSNTRTIAWDPSTGALTDEGHILSPTTILNHEVDHALQHDQNPEQYLNDKNSPDPNYGNKEEKRVITGSEQDTAKKLGEIKEGDVTRTSHKGATLIPVTSSTSTIPVDAVIITVPQSNDQNK